jgi:hypothetical protein
MKFSTLLIKTDLSTVKHVEYTRYVFYFLLNFLKYKTHRLNINDLTKTYEAYTPTRARRHGYGHIDTANVKNI